VVWLVLGRRRPLPVIGPVLVAAAIAGVSIKVSRPPDGLLEGLLLLAVAGALTQRWRSAPLVVAVAALPGAWFVAARAGLPQQTWIESTVVVFAALGGALVTDFDERLPALTPALLGLACAGVYTIVPDTELALVLLGASIGVVLMAPPLGRARVGAGGPLVCGLVAWVVVVEGHTRPGAVVAGLACLGVLLAEPLGRGRARPVVLVCAQVAVVAVFHVLGHRHDAGPVFVEGAAVIAGLAVVLRLVPRARLRT
jgi:hypothetical protein